MAEGTWWKLVSGLPTPKTLVKQAVGSPEAARQVINGYQEAAVTYMIGEFFLHELKTLVAKSKEKPAEANKEAQTSVKTKARKLFDDNVRPYVMNRLSEERNYMHQSFRLMFRQWVHKAQHSSLKPRNQKMDTSPEQRWNQICREMILDRCLRRLKTQNDEHALVVRFSLKYATLQPTTLFANFVNEHHYSKSSRQFQRVFNAAFDLFGQILLMEVRQHVGEENKIKEWHEFEAMNLIEYSLKSKLLTDYFGLDGQQMDGETVERD